MDHEDLLIEALARMQNSKGANADIAHRLKLKYLHTPHDPKLTDDERRVMNELANSTDFEDLDFGVLYKIIDETNRRMRGYFSKQNETLHNFYNKTETDIEHLKSLLSIKMQVQMQRTGEGFAEAVDRLVSGELLSRQAFQELYSGRESHIKMLLDEIRARIANITIDCNIFPIMQLMKELNNIIKQSEQRLVHERVRRKTFASHVEIVGKDIVEILLKQDKLEVEAHDDYWHSMLYFNGQVQEVRRAMNTRESTHLIEMEALTNDDDRRIEQMQFHRAMVEFVRIIQVELMNLEERLNNGIMLNISEKNEEAYDIWVYIQTVLLQKRLYQLRNTTEGRIFRGINPELAKVLTGAMGMLRSGIRINPKSGCYVPNAPFDPADPFTTITDPGDVYREWYEQQLANAVEQIRQENDDLRHEQEMAEMERLRLEDEQRDYDEQRRRDELEMERQAIRNANVDVTVDTVLQDIVDENNHDEDIQHVADDLRKDQKELLAVLHKKRAEIENNGDISDEEKAKLLAIWDDKIRMMEDMLKDEALGLISYLQSQQQDEEVEPEVVPDENNEVSLRELELLNELEKTKAVLDSLQATVNIVPEEIEDEITAAEKLLHKKEKEWSAFEKANADKLNELDELIRQRKQARLMGELGDLADDDLDALGLDEELRALQMARLAHAEELEHAKGKLVKKRQDVQDRQEAKRRAILEAQRREAELRKELMDQDDEADEHFEEENGLDENVLVERRKRFEENQRLRREAELARLDEEQRRAIANASDASEAKRLMKEFESNKLSLLKKLHQEEVGQKAKLDEALKRRQDARTRKQQLENEDPIVRMERKKKARELIIASENAIVHGEQLSEEKQEQVRQAQEIIFEDDENAEEDAALEKLSQEQRQLYLAQREKFLKDKDARIQARKDARRKRLENEQKKDAEREKAKEMERLQRIHHDLELDLIEESLLQELEEETKNIVDEALGLAGIEVYNVFAAESRKKKVESKIERVKQELDDAKEANEAKNVEEAQKLLEQAAKERETMNEQNQLDQDRQAKLLQEKLQQRKSLNASKIKEDREKRRREENERLEFAQKNAELQAQLSTIKALVGMVPEAQREAEARKIIEAQLNENQSKEKVSMLGTQSAERKMFWKEKMLENDDPVLDEVQKLVSDKYDKEHSDQLKTLENKQMDEIKYFYSQLFPKANLNGPEWSVDQGKRALHDLAKRKQDMLEEEKRKKEEEFERRKRELEEKEKQLEEENQRKFDALQNKKAADDAEYQQLISDHDEKLLKNHQLLLSRKQQLLDAELQGSNVQDHDMRNRLVAQQKEEMAKYEAALKEEYQRQRQAMVKRLQLRRQLQEQRKNNDERKRKLEERKKKRMDERVKAREDLEKLQQKEQADATANATANNTENISSQQAGNTTAAASGKSGTQAVGRRRGQVSLASAAAGVNDSIGAQLRQDEVEQKAKIIELQIQKEEDEKKAKREIADKMDALRELLVQLDNKKRNDKEKPIFMDEKDRLIKPMRAAQFESNVDNNAEIRLQPEPKQIASMLPREFVLYRFGVNLLKLFAEQGIFELPAQRRRAQGNGSNVPSLLIASGLPPSVYKDIAFPNSYYYDHVENRLWIRNERLSDPGEFILVLLHALAHIASSNTGDNFHDHDVDFLKAFYSYMRIVCSDMYFNRSTRALSSVGEQIKSPLYTVPAMQYSDEKKDANAAVSVEDIELFDSEAHTSLLPNKFVPRIPKNSNFKVETLDLTSSNACDIVDDLIDIHVGSSDNGDDIYNTGASARKTYGVVLSSSHGMSYFNTSQMVQRLSQYEAFASSSKLRQFLINVEKKQAGYNATREKLGKDRYEQQDGTVERANAKDNESKLTYEQEDVLPVPVMQDVCDELNRQLISVIDQCFESSAKIQQLDKKSHNKTLNLHQRTQLLDTLEAERIILSRLDREKNVLMQRIKRLENKDIPSRIAQKNSDFNAAGVTASIEAEKKVAYNANNDELDLDLDL